MARISDTRTKEVKSRCLPSIYTMTNYIPPKKVVVIGCGGTGGHVVPHLARLIGVLNGGRDTIQLILADGDSVEEKNLTRQNFVAQDLGKNKAQILAGRYSQAFGFEIVALTNDLETTEAINDAIGNPGYASTIAIIGCVDNNASRKLIANWFDNNSDRNSTNKFWVDSGNEESAGQVVCGFSPTNNMYYNRGIMSENSGTFSLPNALELYPDLASDAGDFNSSLSCAERAESAPQNMQTNVTAATVIMNFLQKILRGGALKSHAVDFSIDNVFTTKLNTPENLSKVSTNRRREWEKHYV